MGSLTIGAFARASRLSAKALRRYDELGLLRPARVDAYTGYRYYEATQLARARLVVWLRRIGMPLAGIREVCDLYETDAAAAARAVRDYWARVEAETAARRDLATFLVGQLSVHPAGKDAAMSSHPPTSLTTPPAPTLGIRYAARSDRGLVRETNQDTAYAGSRLLAVADGYGEEGAPASAAAIEAMKSLPDVPGLADLPDLPDLHGLPGLPGGELLSALAESVERANRAVDGFADSGTTLTAMLWTGSRLALVHIGDSRAYLLRDGELFQITHDHTVVQSMIDEGTLTPEEAASHPQRAILLKALDGTEAHTRPDLHLQDAHPGDRYLLCSDGLFTALPPTRLHRTLTQTGTPTEAVDHLITLTHESGAPDNIACVVADVIPL
ncbi:MerR family transcriptional regulator [Streptomyces sp. NPDC056244]|uniref:MerR family transcriptional regulator n=1 Tax=Streptomyces sp. NPDC056244 TaxID=3345762 RepID=UPI0035E30E0F